MAFIVDPNQETETTEFVREQYAMPGRKVLQCVGTFKTSSSTGTEYYRCKFVVISDLEDKGDEGNVVWRNFFLTAKSVGFIIGFAKSVGHGTKFDASREDLFDQIAKQRPFIGELREGGDYGPEIKRFMSVASSQVPDNYHHISEKSQAQFEDWVSWKKSSKATYSSAPSNHTSRNDDRYDDIPF